MPEAMVNQITELDNREIYNWIIENAEGKKLSQRKGIIHGFWEWKKET